MPLCRVHEEHEATRRDRDADVRSSPLKWRFLQKGTVADIHAALAFLGDFETHDEKATPNRDGMPTEPKK
jgi:hypothetical protein